MMRQEETFQAMQILLNDYEAIRALMDQKWCHYPPGSLSETHRDDKTYYRYNYPAGGRQHQVTIPANTAEGVQLMQELQEKRLAYHARPLLRRNTRALRTALADLTPYEPNQRVAGTLPPVIPDNFLLPGQVNLSTWIADTITGNFPTNPFKKEHLLFNTADGNRVRSKSEVFWCDALAAIPAYYRYECGLLLKSGKMVYPDFTILHPYEKRLVYVEHFGRMDDSRYAIEQLSKIQAYAKSGYVPGHDLFFTAETKDRPLTKQQVDLTIQQIGLL